MRPLAKEIRAWSTPQTTQVKGGRTNDCSVAPHCSDGANDKHEDVGGSRSLGGQSQGRHNHEEGVRLQPVHHPGREREPARALALRDSHAGSRARRLHLRCTFDTLIEDPVM